MITFQQKVIAQNGNANSSAQGANWRSNGNAATTSDFIGTTNNQSLIFKVYNFERALIDANGDFIIKDPIPITGNLGGGGGRFIISPGTINRTIPTSPIAAYMLKVGGSGFFDGEVNARKLFIEDQITFMKSLKGPRIDVDTIKMDNNKGIYGNTRVFGDVDVKQDLSVAGNATIGGELRSMNLANANDALIYADATGTLRVTSAEACSTNVPLVKPAMTEGNTGGQCGIRIGTKDNSILKLITNGQDRISIEPGRTTFYGNSVFHSTGKLSINTTASSSYQLFVNGDSKLSGDLAITGKIGIGTNNPQKTMDIFGSLQINPSGEPEWTNHNWKAAITTPNRCAWQTSSVADNGKYIGFGMTNSGWFFMAADNLSATSPVCYPMYYGISSSDPKTNVLTVSGYIKTNDVLVSTDTWCDYVFNKDYKLKSIKEVEDYINTNHHLPGIPSAKEIESKGQNLGEIQKAQMEKIEEMMLFIIELKKQNENLQKQIDVLKVK